MLSSIHVSPFGTMILKCSILFLLLLALKLSVQGQYKGESFPVRYLLPDHQLPEYSDVNYYLQGLSKMLGHFAKFANETDINRALGMFYMKAVLKRTMKENWFKIEEAEQKLIKRVILQADDVTSHFFSHNVNHLTWADILKRAANLLREPEVELQMEAIGKFKRNRLEKWILSNVTLNDFQQSLDELKMSKEMYLTKTEEVIDFEKDINYTIRIDDSDYCLSEVIYNPLPREGVAYNHKTMKPCVADPFCSKIVYRRSPSFSYGLSHRMLNVMMVHHVRRCYMLSLEDDLALMEALCSSMYREAVYLARRGYFNRDIWMEHIALCGLFGYEEFFRRHWFRKVVSWIDEKGCVAENFNYEANRTRYLLTVETRPEKRARIIEVSQMLLASRCHWHQMALSLVVLAHGVRHAVHFSEGPLHDEL